MASIFIEKSVLIALHNPPTRKMMAGILKLLQFKHVETAEDGGQAFVAAQERSFDIVVTEIDMAPHDGHYLIDKIRHDDAAAINADVPVILTIGQSVQIDIEALRREGFTDLLLSPFSFDDVKMRLCYVLEHFTRHSTPKAPSPAIAQLPPNPNSLTTEKDQELVKSLLGHYMAHHETVLQKLRFAQDATNKSIQEIRNVRAELESHDNASIASFSRFETMWEEIIALFLKGGVSENNIFQIEDLITDIPADIRKHYDALTQQDKSFLTMIEALNHDAYRKARKVALDVQSPPNMLTGLTRENYHAKAEKVIGSDDAFVFQPHKTPDKYYF